MATSTLRRERVVAAPQRLQRLIDGRDADVDAVCESFTVDHWEPTDEAWKAIRILLREFKGADLERLTLVYKKR